MKNSLVFSIISFLSILFHYSEAQVYCWEKVEDAVFEGDTICYAFTGGISIPQSEPTLFDLDKDGKPEFYFGVDGKISRANNSGTKGNPCWEMEDEPLTGISIDPSLGDPSPSFADISGDGLPDLIFGDSDGGGNGGTIHYYKNTGNQFEFVTDTLWGLDFYDFSDPCGGDVDGDGDTDVVIGNGLGSIFFMRNLGNNQWDDPDTLYFDSGYKDDKASPTLGDLNNDGILELLVGDASGRIKLFEIVEIGQDTLTWKLKDHDYIPEDEYLITINRTFSNPILIDFDEDELLDLVLANKSWNEYIYHKNIGTLDSAVFSYGSPLFPFNLFPGFLRFSAVDLDNNGKEELIFIHSSTDYITIYSNMGSVDAPNWQIQISNLIDSILLFSPQDSINLAITSYVIHDINGDSLDDIIITNIHEPRLMYFQNISESDDLKFQYVKDPSLENIDGISSGSSMTVGDLDHDNNPELFIRRNDTLHHYEYFGIPEKKWHLKSNNFEPSEIRNSSIIDFDYDGKTDFITHYDRLRFYKNIGSLDSPEFELQLPMDNYAPKEIDGIGKYYFGNFDGKCGRDIIVKGTGKGVLLWGFRGIQPMIEIPEQGVSYEICDSTMFVLDAKPSGGIWGGPVSSNGTFQPSLFEIGNHEITYSYTDPESCYTKTDTLIVEVLDCTVSTFEVEHSINKLEVFPNPVDRDFLVSFYLNKSDNVKISITTLYGQEILIHEGYKNEGQHEISLSRHYNIPPGLYLIRVSQKNNSDMRKIIML